MIPETVSIFPPEWDWVVVYGIGGMAVVIAIAWVAMFSLGNARRTLVIDIITGAGALIIFVFLKSGSTVAPGVLWAWNIWGSFCLVVIAITAITASPFVRLFGDDPEHLNTWVLYFPYVWLPVVLVTIAISGHIVIWRKLLSKSTT